MTREEIEELRKVRDENPELLTARERSLANLHPVEKGERRGTGRPKGVKNWSTHFKKLMGDEEFLKTIIKQSPKEWNGIVGEYPADVIAAGIITIVTKEVARCVAEGKPLSNATQRSIDLLNRISYGEKKVMDIDEDSGFFDKTNIIFNVVPDRKTEES